MAEKYDVRLLNQYLFDYSKRVASLSLFVRILAYLIGAVLVLSAISFSQLPFLVAIFAIMADLLQWQSDNVKGVAESLLRKLDFLDSFGWRISKTEISDILARSPGNIRKSISWRGPDYAYFDSEEKPGPKRALENLVESSWWSKHLAETSAQIYTIATVVLLLASAVVLIISIETIQNFSVLMNISRVVTSTLLLVITLRLIRFAVDFNNFSRKASQIEGQANDLLKIPDIDNEQAIKLFYEYQFARNSSPLIPTWVWKTRRAGLNELWNDFHR